jgi:hypothetical protein
MRVQLRRQGEHRGHGPPRDDGPRPIYVQAGVEGRGVIRGEEHQVFGRSSSFGTDRRGRGRAERATGISRGRDKYGSTERFNLLEPIIRNERHDGHCETTY